MLIDKAAAIYTGGLSAKKLYIDNKLTYKPQNFSLCTLLKPLVIELSVAGVSGVNGVWSLEANKESYSKPGTVATYGAINRNVNLSGWDIVIGQYGSGTTYYRLSGLNPIPDVLPLTGWRSLNPSYDPVPTIIYNKPVSAVYAAFISSNPNGLTILPTLEPNRDYLFNTENNTFFGIASSTQFNSVTTVNNIDSSIHKNFDFDYFPNVTNVSTNSVERAIFNNTKLKSLIISNASQDTALRIWNNTNLQDINLGGSYFTENNLINNPAVSAFTLGTNQTTTNLNLKNFSNLRNFTITNCPNLTSLQFLSSYPNFERLSLGTTNLSGFEFLDTVLLDMSGKSNPLYTHNSRSNLLGRSSASNKAYLNVFKKNQNINLEIDPLFPLQTITENYFPSTLGNEIVVSCPVSANKTNFVQHTTLSGIYTKIENIIYNNRDIFKNINDFYILYDKDNIRWTVVGPTSSSNTIWLSAQETIGDYGNIPSIGWSGQSFRATGGNITAGNSGWWNQTAVFSTKMYLFSSFMFTGTTTRRNGAFPLSGYNSNFYWSDYDFSGIGYQNVNDPFFNGRWTLVSPVHYINSFHFPESISVGSKINFIHKDGTISTRTILSAVDLPDSFSNDLRLGIFDAPLSAAAYPIGSLTNFITSTSSAIDFKNFLYGPIGTSKVGIGIPSTANNDCRYNIAPTTYTQITSIPKSLWFTEGVNTGDSSSQFWYAEPSNKQLIVLGLTKFVGPVGPALLDRNYTTLYNIATALCLQFYGTPLMYQLTAYNF